MKPAMRCRHCNRVLCKEHEECFCIGADEWRDERKASRNVCIRTCQSVADPVVSGGSHSLSPLAPSFVSKFSLEPFPASCSFSSSDVSSTSQSLASGAGLKIPERMVGHPSTFAGRSYQGRGARYENRIALSPVPSSLSVPPTSSIFPSSPKTRSIASPFAVLPSSGINPARTRRNTSLSTGECLQGRQTRDRLLVFLLQLLFLLKQEPVLRLLI